MAAQITPADVKSLLTELGYAIPDVVLNLIICQVDKIDTCLDEAGYDDCIQQLIKLYAIALMAASSGARKIKSQSAPSGASRSFEYGEAGLTQLRDSLTAMDVSGCTSGLPITVGNPVGLFMTVRGN
ncbi:MULTISPECIES: hypothetical protein [Yersinia]|uniref:DUF7370 family protein n=1 Tax=Yersinia TaxID=629 RepID=UPI0005DDC75E|nr:MULTISPECIES: hypothetical protein [Yersinia]MDA5527113.1 hypothetical protein [Yersinia mollaretii]MDR7875703.1 hypothetical protein [Yersinia mollaretii]PHZ29913.1 hypothetical protein CS537_19800 [Yersinia mollaretii]WQC76934.1 hypothetical protein U1Z61_10830 [Yersinia mollaretii]CNH62747.1 Uncharacterised protein [Yersinia intermedia]